MSEIREGRTAVTIWMPTSLKKAADKVIERRGDLTRMMVKGLRKEILLKQKELDETLLPEEKAS
jgi:hypothetical protein